MKETIVGALIVGVLIGGAILLSGQHKLHRINGTQDMALFSDDVLMDVQDGNKRIIIKNIDQSSKLTQNTISGLNMQSLYHCDCAFIQFFFT